MHRDPKLWEPAPPGAHAEMLAHPSDTEDREIELAIFKDHRYSFFYWCKWSHRLGHSSPPTLVTIDWHRDLAPPSDKERTALDNLKQEDLNEVRDFTIKGLDPHNDGHLLSAVWLNLIGDIILLKNYGQPQQDTWKDTYSNNHSIIECTEINDLSQRVTDRQDEFLFLDIDLDYFIENKVAPYQRTEVHIYDDDSIRSLIDPGSDLFRHLFERLQGITLATEPRYCGGVRNSYHILEVILNQLFTQKMEWRHLSG